MIKKIRETVSRGEDTAELNPMHILQTILFWKTKEIRTIKIRTLRSTSFRTLTSTKSTYLICAMDSLVINHRTTLLKQIQPVTFSRIPILLQSMLMLSQMRDP
jgi:hypothetical protein